MADFSALKAAIQAVIKQNGNQEITGPILQEVLLSMVNTMGDGAINSLASALSTETTNRQNADGTLQTNINNEATARQNADSGLQTAINSINTRLAEGYVYVGIATAATNPGTPAGKVFYIALQAGTYTNFSSLAVTQGITILKYNGTAWSQDQLVGIDDVPTKESNKLVKSGGVFANIGAFDISEYHKSGNTLATYADLTAALAALPSDFQKGGMSVKYVQTSDNNYVQFRCKANTFTTDVTQWAIDDSGVYIENPHFIAICTDKNKKILIALENDGNVRFGAGVPKQIISYVEEKVAELKGDIDAIRDFLGGLGDTTLKDYLDTIYGKYIEDPDNIYVLTDENKKVVFAIKNNSDVYFGCGCPTQIQKYIENYVQESQTSNVLFKKKYVACGDSFTYGDFTNDTTGTYTFENGKYAGLYKVYPRFIALRNNMELIIDAYNGSTMALTREHLNDPENDERKPFSYQRYMQIPADADYITLWFGINDASHCNLGTIGDSDNTTFYGAWNVVMEWILTNRPNAKVGIVVTNSSTQQFREAERQIAQKWGVSMLDMMGNPLVPDLLGKENQYYSSVARNLRKEHWTVSQREGAINNHPNQFAHEYESTFIENWLRSL